MSEHGQINLDAIRQQAERFNDEAFQFIRDGLAYTLKMQQAEHGSDEQRHVTGQELSIGLRDLAIKRYGMLAETVLKRWGILRTDDFGVLVYAMIDRGEFRSSPDDSIEDFQGVYDFAEEFRGLWPSCN